MALQVLKLTLRFYFFLMDKRSGQNFKYIENEKSFQDELKSVFHHFIGLSLKQINKQIYLEGESPILSVPCLVKLSLDLHIVIGNSLCQFRLRLKIQVSFILVNRSMLVTL